MIGTKFKQTLRVVTVVLSTSAFAYPAAAQSARWQALDEYIESAIRGRGVPGLALAVVKDDSIIVARGYGVREVGKPEPVDEHTLFATGSTGKAFTAAALGMLVDEGKLRWDDPVIERLPGFQLYDPWLTHSVTVRDLMAHRTGLSRSDLLWVAGFDRDELLRRARFLEPRWELRTTFHYNNLMILAAGQIVEAVTGMTWDEFVKRRIFRPLGMTRSNTSTLDLEGVENVAAPHGEMNDRPTRVRYRNLDNVAPGGSINSSVWEYAAWLRLQLARGTYKGRRLLSEEVIDEMHSPQMVIPVGGLEKTLHPKRFFNAYGLGWFMSDYRGRKMLYHGGGIDGMTTLVGMIPEENVGLVLIQNLRPSGLEWPLMYWIWDALLDAPERDWLEEYRHHSLEQERLQSVRSPTSADWKAAPPPSLPIDAYTGVYVDSLYGPIEVRTENGDLLIVFGVDGRWVGELEHRHHDTFDAIWPDRMMSTRPVTFILDALGRVLELTVPLESDTDTANRFRLKRKG